MRRPFSLQGSRSPCDADCGVSPVTVMSGRTLDVGQAPRLSAQPRAAVPHAGRWRTQSQPPDARISLTRIIHECALRGGSSSPFHGGGLRWGWPGSAATGRPSPTPPIKGGVCPLRRATTESMHPGAVSNTVSHRTSPLAPRRFPSRPASADPVRPFQRFPHEQSRLKSPTLSRKGRGMYGQCPGRTIHVRWLADAPAPMFTPTSPPPSRGRTRSLLLAPEGGGLEFTTTCKPPHPKPAPQEHRFKENEGSEGAAMVLGAQPTRELLPLDGGGIQVGVNGGRFEEGLRQSPPSHPSPHEGGKGATTRPGLPVEVSPPCENPRIFAVRLPKTVLLARAVPDFTSSASECKMAASCW
jgi:hypothetical protein